MALGAQRWEVVRLILREVLALAGVAVAVAIPIAIFATRALRSQLFNVSSIDAAIYAAAIAIIVFTAALAGLIQRGEPPLSIPREHCERIPRYGRCQQIQGCPRSLFRDLGSAQPI